MMRKEIRRYDIGIHKSHRVKIKRQELEKGGWKECVWVSEINETWNKVGEIKLNPWDQRSKEGKKNRRE